MATYNGERYIRSQIDSILSQLSDNDELIISDDGSTDSTLSIIELYKDSRIKVLKHQVNPNLKKMKSASFRLAASNFENALNNVHGDRIFLTDQDDVWISGKIKVMSDALDNYDLVMCNFQVIDKNDQIVCDQFYKKSPVSKSLVKNIMNPPFLGCCMAFRREALSYCLPFPGKVIGHDFWMGCLICAKGKFKYLIEPYHKYRKHDMNVSPATSRSKNSFLYKICYRVVFCIQIFARIYSFR
jgi:Glycosyltransferases involved in cell wall biogenesis